MLKIRFLIVLLPLVFFGCATAKTTAPVPSEEPVVASLQEITQKEIKTSPVVETTEGEVNEPLTGVLLAKTDFQGLLQTSYVNLMFENLENPAHRFQLHIGEKTEGTFPWEVKIVQPGYFFVELPAGKYKISSLSIPVGNSVAEEMSDIRVEILPNTTTYVGTLRAVGTKEKIKFGGVPVIKPGFEYSVDIIDEREEASATFHSRFSDQEYPLQTQLMEVNKKMIVTDQVNQSLKQL